jgi:hypothetical protein
MKKVSAWYTMTLAYKTQQQARWFTDTPQNDRVLVGCFHTNMSIVLHPEAFEEVFDGFSRLWHFIEFLIALTALSRYIRLRYVEVVKVKVPRLGVHKDENGAQLVRAGRIGKAFSRFEL